MGQLSKILVIFAILFIGIQCNEEISSKIKVVVLNNQNVPIHNATIMIDNIKIGTTDKDGIYYHELKGIKGKSLKLEVSKDSTTHYYAPYFEKIVLSPDRHNPIKVKAILYSVPKPKKDKSLGKESLEEEDDLPILVDSHRLSDEQDIPQQKAESESKSLGKVDLPESEPEDEAITAPKKIIKDPQEVSLAQTKPFQRDIERLGIEVSKASYTLHVSSQKKNIADAEVYIGDPAKGYLKSACKTNLKGKCTLKIIDNERKAISFVVKKQGYVTKTIATRLKKKGFLRVPLTRGQCLDVFTLKSNYHYLRGVAGIGVFVNGRKVGQTDKFGHLSYVYQGGRDDLLKVAFKTKHFLPEVFETDFVTSPKMTLTRFLTDKKPPKPRFTLLPVRLAGNVDAKDLPDINKINRYLKSSSKYIMSLNNATEYPYENMVGHLEKEGKKINDIVKFGWTGLNIKAHVDALILPTILMKNRSIYVDTSLYNNKGEVIAAATHELASLKNSQAYATLMKGLAKKINGVFPFEGAVLGASKGAIRINLSKKSSPFLEKGDLVEVYGRQINSLGSSQEHKKIAIAQIQSTSKNDASAKIVWQSPRSVIGRGDMIILRKGVSEDHLKSKQFPIFVGEKGLSKKGVAQVNVYMNGKWIGSSNESGLVAIRNSKDFYRGGSLTFVKHGYETKNVSFSGDRKKRLDVGLNRLLAFVQIDSKPAGAKVYLDGSYVGQTPLRQPFQTSSGFIKLKLKAPPGYKDLAQVLELEEGVLDLTGGASILLEREILKGIKDLVKLGSFNKAISMLENVSVKHSDYLHAQHLMGEIYLSKLKDPKQAANSFERVLENPQVKTLYDKKFIGTYINYAEALSMIAQKEEDNWETAKGLYEKIVTLSQVANGSLKFAPPSQRALAGQKLLYYEALALTRLASKSNDIALKRQSMDKWRDFVAVYQTEEGSAKQELSDLLGNAKVYLKQAKSNLYQNDANF